MKIMDEELNEAKDIINRTYQVVINNRFGVGMEKNVCPFYVSELIFLWIKEK